MHRSEFEKFVVAIKPGLLARATSVTGDADAAADIVQDCMLKLWTMREQLDDYDRPEALAMTIVHRLSLNVIRGRKPMLDLNDEIVGGCQLSPEEMAIGGEEAAAVRNVLAMLPDAQQALITMRHIEGLSNSEIAGIVGSTEGAVRAALSRARHRIAEIFTEYQLSKM